MMGIKLIILFALLFCAGCQEAKSQSDYIFYTKPRAWISYYETPQTWDTARLMCAAEGAHLVSPNSTFKETLMWYLNRGFVGNKAYTGIRLSPFTGQFQTLEGTPLNTIRYQWVKEKLEEPSRKKGEECLIMDVSGRLDVVDCEVKYPYFCYKTESTWVDCGADTDYNYYPRARSCYKLHQEDRENWYEAKQVCQSEGAHLAVINSPEEALVIRNIVYDKHVDAIPRVGLRRNTENGRDWKTIDGRTLTEAGYDLWTKDTTGKYEDQLCAGVEPTTGLLDYVLCGYKSRFICEKEISEITENCNDFNCKVE